MGQRDRPDPWPEGVLWKPNRPPSAEPRRETPCLHHLHPYFAIGLQIDPAIHSCRCLAGLRSATAALVVLMVVVVGVLAAHPGWHAALHGHLDASAAQEQHPDDEGAGDSDGCAVCGWVQQQILPGLTSESSEVFAEWVTVVRIEPEVGLETREVEAPGDPRGPPDRA